MKEIRINDSVPLTSVEKKILISEVAMGVSLLLTTPPFEHNIQQIGAVTFGISLISSLYLIWKNDQK